MNRLLRGCDVVAGCIGDAQVVARGSSVEDGVAGWGDSSRRGGDCTVSGVANLF